MVNLVLSDKISVGEQSPRVTRYEWKSEVVTYDSGKEQRNQVWERPKRYWTFNFNWLTATARAELLEIFNRTRGMYNTFLLADIIDYACGLTDWSYTATGTEATTQLAKTYYKGETEEWTENKTRIQPSAKYTPTIKIDGVAQTEGVNFTLDDGTGIITWTSAITVGKVITADYRFYYPVRFVANSKELTEHQIGYHDGFADLIEVIE